MLKKTILIDAGHGINTPGKRSPDGKLLEWEKNREIARYVLEHLALRDINARLLVHEDEDISLQERCRRANEESLIYGISNTVLLSIHCNASGNGSQWMTATGWCAYTSKGETEADKFATCLYRAAERHLPGHKIRKDYSDGDPDFESQFYILRHTYAPAVLTENLFYDAFSDYQFLLSERGMRAIVGLHVDGICDYLRGK